MAKFRVREHVLSVKETHTYEAGYSYTTLADPDGRWYELAPGQDLVLEADQVRLIPEENLTDVPAASQ